MSNYHEINCNCELCKLGAKVKNLEAGLKIAHDMLCHATFYAPKNEQKELNWAIDKLKALEGKE